LIARRGSAILTPDDSYEQLGSLLIADVNLCNEHEASEEYASIMDKASVLNAFGEPATLSELHGFQVIAFWDEPDKGVLTAPARNGFHVFEVQARLEDYMKTHDIDGYLDSRPSLNESEPHPSNFTHRLDAGQLQEFMKDDDTVGQYE
jgi:hypothetical protein